MSSGKADSETLIRSMKQVKANAVRRSEREHQPNIRRYPGLGRGGGRGRGGRRVGGEDFDPPPSASGSVAPEFFLEGPSRAETETETESRAEGEEGEEDEEAAGPKKLKTRGESRVPEEKDEPKTHDEKWLIVPTQKE